MEHMDTTELVRALRTYTKDSEDSQDALESNGKSGNESKSENKGESKYTEISGTELAQLLERITEREVAEGGPYRLLPGENADISVEELNLAIVEFLRTYGISLPNLAEYNEHIETRESQLHTGGMQRVREWEEKTVLANIQRMARQRLATMPEEFQQTALDAIMRTTERNLDKQMSLMPLFMLRALGRKETSLSASDINEMGLVNVFFWTAFIIYDDFWDEDEAADPRLLPVANLFARHYVEYFSKAFENTEENTKFNSFFHQLMDRLDAANAWETQYCRMEVRGSLVVIPEELPEYGTYENKFYPASGHIVGPIAMLVRLGYAVDSPEVASLRTYFQNYLIAMQLNDDLHDWKEDLQRGHISTVVVKILEEWKSAYPHAGEIGLGTNMPELERIFWFEVLVPMCHEIRAHCAASRAALSQLTFLEITSPLEQFIIRNEESANKILTEYALSTEFISAIAP
jgi:hypothetical protein